MVVNYNIKDYRKERWNGFKDFYIKTIITHEVDPASPAMKYFCNKLNLTLEQRYWISFLYGICYCVPTTYYIFKHFPDYNKIDEDEIQSWWDKNKKNLVFQSDRRKVKSFNLFLKIFKSYKSIMGESQHEAFSEFTKKDSYENYNDVYDFCSKIYYFGRFSLFNYLDSLNSLTNLNLLPSYLNLKDAESSRNGLCYACNKDNFITLHHKQPKEPVDYDFLQSKLELLEDELKKENPDLNINLWNIETSLCAYKKQFWETRYFGYYIDRQLDEINKMNKTINDEDFKILFEFREKIINEFFLGEKRGWNGIRKKRFTIFNYTGKLIYPYEKIPNIIENKNEFKFFGDKNDKTN